MIILLKLKITHPEIYKVSKNGCFSLISIISLLFEELNLTKREDISKDLKLTRIKIYGEYLETLI